MIVSITVLSILIGYSIALTASVLTIIHKKRTACRIEGANQSSGSSRDEAAVVKADPDATSEIIAGWACLVLFSVGGYSFSHLEDFFTWGTPNIFIIGMICFLLITLLLSFRYIIMRGGQEIAIFSEQGITMIGAITGSESAIPWHDVDEFTYAMDEFGFSHYVISAGKRSIFIDEFGDQNKKIMRLIVKRVPQSMWKKADLHVYLTKHFGLTFDENH